MENRPYKIYRSEAELQENRYKEAANTTYTKRYRTLLKLIRISKMISNAKIVDTPILKEK